MDAKKIEACYNKYFPIMWAIAKEQRLSKGRWIILSGLDPQRFAEFARTAKISDGNLQKKSRNVLPYYMLSLLRGLSMTADQLEEKSGTKFSAEQRAALNFKQWIKVNEQDLRVLMSSPEKCDAVKSTIKL